MSERLAQFEQYQVSKFDDPYLYSVNRTVFEKNSAKIIFDNFYGNRLWDEDYFYIILGCDSGLLTNYVLEHGLAKGSRYLFIDSEHVLENLKNQLSFTQWDDKVAFATLSTWEVEAEKFHLQAYMYTDKVRYIKSLAANDGFDDYYYQANTKISLKLETQQHYTMVSLYRAPFVVKQIINLADNINPMIALKDKFKGMDCIILGGGPSLDEIIDKLNALENKVVIIAVSRIAKRLLSEKITPHFVISVDPHEVSFDVSKEMLEMADDAIFLHSTYVVPVLLGQWRGVSFHDGLRVPWPSELAKDNTHLAGPTVTNSAISAALDFGFKRIFLSGVDLCYASDGHTHAKGSNEAKVGPVLGKREQWVKTYSSKMAETMLTFIHATKTIAEQAKEAQKRGAQLYNLSPNAAAIENILLADIDKTDFAKEDLISPILTKIKNKYGKINTQQFTDVKNDIDRLLTELDLITEIVEQALEDNHNLYKTYESELENSKIKDRIDFAEEQLNSEFKETTTFLKKYGIHRFIQIARTDADLEWSDEEMEEIGRKYYQCFIDNINELKPLLSAAKKKIDLRQREILPQQDYHEIFEQWRSEHHYGRAYGWKQKNPTLYQQLNDLDKKELDEQITEYFKILDNNDTYHLKRTQAQSSLTGINRKAVYLFNDKNIEGLETLVSNLEKLEHSQKKTKDKIKRPENLSQLILLCAGYLALLQGHKQRGLEKFYQLDEQHLSEDELIQISVIEIDLQHYQQAEKSLKQLSDLTSSYQPQYATMLKLNKKITEAEEVYLTYLEQHHHDLKVWLALANLYIENNAIAPAKEAFKQIQALDPNNIEAQQFFDSLNA
ncbi:6-hydroxymethylpterin diphosphokinase MptE-like protein [Thalassotalea piscium]